MVLTRSAATANEQRGALITQLHPVHSRPAAAALIGLYSTCLSLSLAFGGLFADLTTKLVSQNLKCNQNFIQHPSHPRHLNTRAKWIPARAVHGDALRYCGGHGLCVQHALWT